MATTIPEGQNASATSIATLYTPVLTSLLGLAGTTADIKAQSDATVSNIESASKSLNYSLRVKNQQLKDLERITADRLSASGLEQMKRQARLKAASAETGTGNVKEVIQASYMEENFKLAAIQRDKDINKHNIKQQMVAERLSFDNQVDSMISQMPSSTSVFLQTLGAGISGFSSGLNLLSQDQQNEILGVDTTGTQTQG